VVQPNKIRRVYFPKNSKQQSSAYPQSYQLGGNEMARSSVPISKEGGPLWKFLPPLKLLLISRAEAIASDLKI